MAKWKLSNFGRKSAGLFRRARNRIKYGGGFGYIRRGYKPGKRYYGGKSGSYMWK